MTSMTKKQLLEENAQLRIACENLRKQVGDMALKLAAATVPQLVVYPLVDKLGQHYRMERGIHCYPAKH